MLGSAAGSPSTVMACSKLEGMLFVAIYAHICLLSQYRYEVYHGGRRPSVWHRGERFEDVDNTWITCTYVHSSVS